MQYGKVFSCSFKHDYAFIPMRTSDWLVYVGSGIRRILRGCSNIVCIPWCQVRPARVAERGQSIFQTRGIYCESTVWKFYLDYIQLKENKSAHIVASQLNRQIILLLNPILTGGGSIWPPPARNPRLPRDRRRSRHAFSWLFSFKSSIFWYQVCENRTVREVTWRFVLARRHKICPSAFCIGLCTKHMEITDFH